MDEVERDVDRKSLELAKFLQRRGFLRRRCQGNDHQMPTAKAAFPKRQRHRLRKILGIHSRRVYRGLTNVT